MTVTLDFHNTSSGELFPSRKQIMERSFVKKDVVINATRKRDALATSPTTNQPVGEIDEKECSTNFC